MVRTIRELNKIVGREHLPYHTIVQEDIAQADKDGFFIIENYLGLGEDKIAQFIKKDWLRNDPTKKSKYPGSLYIFEDGTEAETYGRTLAKTFAREQRGKGILTF